MDILLLHPRYSPDIVPSNYYPLRNLQNHLSWKKVQTFNEEKKVLADFFDSKPETFTFNLNSNYINK